jgi:hypothetical protein
MFTPKFRKVYTIGYAADLINLPHEDYPLRVNRTIELIDALIYRHDLRITEHFIRSLHAQFEPDLPANEIGIYRTLEIGSLPDVCLAIQVSSAMYELHPFEPTTFDQLIEWYMKFETIHPFTDMNGRVGGTIVAAFSYILSQEFYLSPCQ